MYQDGNVHAQITAGDGEINAILKEVVNIDGELQVLPLGDTPSVKTFHRADKAAGKVAYTVSCERF